MAKITDLQNEILTCIFRHVVEGRTSLEAFDDLRSIKHTCVRFYDVIEENLERGISMGIEKLVLRRNELNQLPKYLKFLSSYDELVRIDMPDMMEYSYGLSYLHHIYFTKQSNLENTSFDLKFQPEDSSFGEMMENAAAFSRVAKGLSLIY